MKALLSSLNAGDGSPVNDSSLVPPLGTETAGQAAAAEEGDHHQEDDDADDHSDKLYDTKNVDFRK